MRQAALLVASALALGAPRAQAQRGSAAEVEACASASEAGQRLRSSQRLGAARERLLVCARSACPSPIKRDCDELLSQIDAAMPTAILAAKDAAGQDLIDVRVSLDGKAFTSSLDGRAIPLDPGPHVFVFERDGAARVEQHVVLREGEKARRVEVELASPREPARAPPTVPASRHAPVAAYGLVALGLAALGVFTFLAVSGQHDYDRCKNAGCSADDASAVKRERVFAWTAMGVALAAGGAAVYLFVSAPNGAPALAARGTF
jgi:hypothetical protein